MKKDLTSIHINFTNETQINELFLRMFGQDVYVPPVSMIGIKWPFN